MRDRIKSFNADVEFRNGSDEGIDVCKLRGAIERQVRVSLDLDEGTVHVLPFAITAREVTSCDFCDSIDEEAKEQHPTLWNQGDRFVEIAHACEECLHEYSDLLKRIPPEEVA
jgi:hypothetical protein